MAIRMSRERRVERPDNQVAPVLCRPQERGRQSAGQLVKKRKREEDRKVREKRTEGHRKKERESASKRGDAQLWGCLHFSGSCICESDVADH